MLLKYPICKVFLSLSDFMFHLYYSLAQFTFKSLQYLTSQWYTFPKRNRPDGGAVVHSWQLVIWLGGKEAPGDSTSDNPPPPHTHAHVCTQHLKKGKRRCWPKAGMCTISSNSFLSARLVASRMPDFVRPRTGKLLAGHCKFSVWDDAALPYLTSASKCWPRVDNNWMPWFLTLEPMKKSYLQSKNQSEYFAKCLTRGPGDLFR